MPKKMAAVVEDIARALAAKDAEAFDAAGRKAFDSLDAASTAELDSAQRKLVALMKAAPPSPAGMMAVLCGAIVENGGDLRISFPTIFSRTKALIPMARKFVNACRAEAKKAKAGRKKKKGDDDEDGDEPSAVEKYGERLSQKIPGFASLNSLSEHCHACIALLSRSKELRRKARKDAALAKGLKPIRDEVAYGGFLLQMLRVLDDETLLVLHPETKKGYRISISGIADNFQFQILLADALIGDPKKGWLKGKRPSARVVAASKDGPAVHDLSAEGSFNLHNWTGLRPDGTLSNEYSESKHWIWGEGVPDDIKPFQKTRVVLLGPLPYTREFGAQRCFAGMAGEMKVVETLTPEAVEKFLSKIINAKRK